MVGEIKGNGEEGKNVIWTFYDSICTHKRHADDEEKIVFGRYRKWETRKTSIPFLQTARYITEGINKLDIR